MYLMLLFID